MRKVFLDDLPKSGSQINWENSIGYKVKFIYNNIEDNLEIINFYRKDGRSYLSILYQNRQVNICTSDFKRGQLGNLLNIKTTDFKYKIDQIIKDDKRNIKIIKCFRNNNKRNLKYYKYKCLKCGNEEIIAESDLIRGNGCNTCGSSHKKIKKGLNDLWTTHPYIAKLLKYPERGYEISYGSRKNEIFICNKCGVESPHIIANVVHQRFSCPRCSDGISYPEKFIFDLLKQLEIKFETQKSFEWVNNKLYDFYINNLDIIIETHGKQHYEKRSKNSRFVHTLEEEQENDKYKKRLAKENCIEHYIVIDCRKSELNWIKNSIIKSKLPELLNFKESDIDWLKCQEYACNSLVKVVCNMWNSGFYKILEIADKLKISKDTVRTYLKQGAELGLCDYNSNLNQIRSGQNQGKRNSRKVILLNTKEIFESIIEAQSKYKCSHISMCCNKLRNLAGKHPETGEPLRWAYYDEYIKQQNISA